MDELEMRLQALMRQEYVPTPQIRVPQENDMDDLQERLYRLEPRHRQLQISDYPLLRNRMIYDLILFLYLRGTDGGASFFS